MLLRHFFFVLIIGLMSGCASLGQFGSTTPSWSYSRTTMRPPITTYGVPNTAVQMAIECLPSEMAVQIEFIDSAIYENRPIELVVADVSYRGFERLDMPNGMAVSRITVPWNEPVLDSFAGGAGNIMIIAANERFQLPSGRLPQQMVKDCLKLRF